MTTAAGVSLAPNHSDAGNGERFAGRNRAWVRYCYAWGRWLTWSGTHWRRDDGDRVMRLAKETAKNIYLEAAGAASEDERRQIAKWALASESEARLCDADTRTE